MEWIGRVARKVGLPSVNRTTSVISQQITDLFKFHDFIHCLVLLCYPGVLYYIQLRTAALVTSTITGRIRIQCRTIVWMTTNVSLVLIWLDDWLGSLDKIILSWYRAHNSSTLNSDSPCRGFTTCDKFVFPLICSEVRELRVCWGDLRTEYFYQLRKQFNSSCCSPLTVWHFSLLSFYLLLL